MTRRAWLYIVSVILAGAALAGFAIVQPFTAAADHLLLAALLIIAATLSQLFKSRFKSRVQSERGASAYSPMLVFLFAGIFLLPPPLYVLLVTVPLLVEWLRERLRRSVSLSAWYIQPFNISTFLLAGLATQGLSTALQLALPASSLTGVLLAMCLATVYLVINHYLVGQVLVLAREVTWPETGVWRLDNLLADFFMLLYGSIVPSLWTSNPWLLLPALSPLYLIQRALAVPQLRRSEEDLRRAKTELEAAVDQRTRELRRAYQKLQAVSQQLVRVQEEERTHLARELHDQIGQALTVVRLNLQTLQRLPEAAAVAPWLERSIHEIERTMAQVRDLSRALRPSVLDDLGLGAALRSFIDQQAETAGFVPEVIITPSDLRASPTVETACFRVVQEAVTNVMRHAQAQHVRIELQQCGRDLELSIRDDGIGFDPQTVSDRVDHDGHLGLMGIQERILLVGGVVEIRSALGHGTEIHARVPIEPERDGHLPMAQAIE